MSQATPNLEIGPLTTVDGLAHGFFSRAGGVSEGLYDSLNCGLGSKDAPVRVIENRGRAARSLGLEADNLVTVYQRHSNLVTIVEEPWKPGRGPKVDGMATGRAGIALGILTADCAPVLLADARARVIGAAHAGWRGAKSGILEAVLAAMEALGAERRNILAAVGPCIGPQSYEVGDEFEGAFLADDSANGDLFQPGSATDKRRFDLAGYVLRRLERAGLGEAGAAGRDTFADRGYFSYRRAVRAGEPDFGRLISVIALVR